MHKASLHFKSQATELLYKQYRWTNNIFPIKGLILFNFLLHISINILSIRNEKYYNILFSLLALMILYIFYRLSLKLKYNSIFQDLYVIFSVLILFMVGTFISCASLDEGNSNGIEWFFAGVIFQMYFCYLHKFKLNWYFLVFAKIAMLIFLISMDIMFEKEKIMSDHTIILVLLTFSSFYINFIQDQNERILWEKEYYNSCQNEIFHNLLEEIPDQVIVWSLKKELIYANKSSCLLFGSKNYEKLKESLLKNLDINEFQCSGDETETSDILTKLDQIFQIKDFADIGFIAFTANIQTSDERNQIPLNMHGRQSEFDIKMKKIFWEKEVAVMMFLNKVDERNLNSRLEYVNSFLNYVLGNISHDIYTPLNVLFGMIENLIDSVKDIAILSQLYIARNHGDILLSTIRMMIDLFNIRKGSLVLNITELDFENQVNDVLELFKENMTNKNIKCNIFKETPNLIHTDVQRFREVIIAIMSHCLKQLQDGQISFEISSCEGLENTYQISIQLKGNIQKSQNNPQSFVERLHNKSIYDTYKIANHSPINSLQNYEPQIELDMGFSLVDFIILCLSSGKDDHLLTKTTNEEALGMEIMYKFKIQDKITLDRVLLIDPFKEKHHLSLSYIKLENSDLKKGFSTSSFFSPESSRTQNNLIIAGKSTEWSINTHQSPKLSTLLHHMKSKNVRNSCKILHKMTGIKKQETFKDSLFIPSIDSILEFKNNEKNKKLFILNTDDFLFNLMVITNYCKFCGCDIIEANNGLEAVKAVENQYKENERVFDLIFMDCDMPIMDGFEASEKINKFYNARIKNKPPIIAITANVLNDDINTKIKNSGIQEVVMKPLRIKGFKEILNKYLNADLI